MRIDIDYVAGSPYLYLEYTLNTAFVTGDLSKRLEQIEEMPERIFFSGRYGKEQISKKRICITFTQEDLLHVSLISLTKNDLVYKTGSDLEVDTFKQLNNEFYKDHLEIILAHANVIPKLYYDLKGDDWPNIQTVQEFYILPQHIIQECKDAFGFQPIEASEQNPDIHRPILRNYFTKWYEDTAQHPFYKLMLDVKYSEDTDVYYFPFADFFDIDRFLSRLDDVAKHFGLEFVDKPEVPRNLKDIKHLHEDFIRRHQFTGITRQTDQILYQIERRKSIPIKLLLFQEAYINAKLGNVMQDLVYISNTSQIIDCIT